MRRVLALAVLVPIVSGLLRLASPVPAHAFTLTGESLGVDQRGFRVQDAFPGPLANDNVTPQPSFPGQTGAPLAIWKAHVEWASVAYAGTGIGDGLPSNPVLGDGGANFDNLFGGVSATPGSSNGNVHAPLPGLGPLLGFVETPVGDGWRVRYNADLLWDDGPGAPAPGAIDLQGVATRFVGNTLGLATSAVPGATMGPSPIGDGTALRSIEADDIAGLQAIYGVAAAAKPRVDAVTGSCVAGDPLVITGTSFAALGNEVWFTDAGAVGEPLVVAGVPSTAGGTRLELLLPAGAADGELLVKVPGATGASLSNAFPLNVVDGGFGFVGPGLAGAAGTPRLAGDGSLVPSTEPVLLLDVSGAAPLAPVTMLVGPASVPTPLKGGTLYPLPIVLQVALGSTDATGRLALVTAIPPGTPSGTFVVLQAWLVDASGPQGLTASNGMSLTVP